MIINRFTRVLGEWVALHDQHLYFPTLPRLPQVMVTKRERRIRANDAFTALSLPLKEALVAHEMGHRELGHIDVGPVEWLLWSAIARRDGHARPLDKELAADRYACGVVGKQPFTRALAELRTLLAEREAPLVTLIDLDARIATLHGGAEQLRDD